MFSGRCHTILRHLCSQSGNKKICIIGSGPAGFYFAQHLIKVLPGSYVDIYDKLPVPFGLVRYGVAPDHQEVKNVIHTFTKTAHLDNVQFIGNVTLGKDVSFKQFQEAYHAVVLTYGCSEDRLLGIPGEELKNVISAREFVGWYNGLPDNVDLKPDLSCDTAVILGQGNVAVDVARILLTPIDILRKTDIPEGCLEELSKSRVSKVYLVGRRGPLQAAFTIKEFREMTKLPNVSTILNKKDMDLEKYLPGLARPRKRLTELMLKTLSTPQTGTKQFIPVFYRKPLSIDGGDKAEAVNFVVQTTSDPSQGGVEETELRDRLEGGLVVRSIGYKGTLADPHIPWRQDSASISTSPGVYGAGWIGNGPVGVILSTMSNAFSQAEHLAKDIKEGAVDISTPKPGFTLIREILDQKNIPTVSFKGWEKIDKVETERGEKLGKVREKICSIDEMLSIGAE